jgi:uncharacterized membrane protein
MKIEEQSSYCTRKLVGFVVALFLLQLSAAYFVLVIGIPYLTNVDEAFEKQYTFDDFDLIKTIWMRIHVIVGSFNMFLGPVQVSMGLMRKAGTKTHKYLGYTYTITMALCIVTTVPLIVLAFMDGRLFSAVTFALLTIYPAVTLVEGIRAIIRGDKPAHRKNMFRNYTAVFSVVTARFVKIAVPKLWKGGTAIVTVLLGELIIWKYPATFKNKPENVDQHADNGDQHVDEDTTAVKNPERGKEEELPKSGIGAHVSAANINYNA